MLECSGDTSVAILRDCWQKRCLAPFPNLSEAIGHVSGRGDDNLDWFKSQRPKE